MVPTEVGILEPMQIRRSGRAVPPGRGTVGSEVSFWVASATQRPSWTLEFRPSLFKMLVTWVSTVRSDKNNRVACHAMIMAITTVVPAPVAILRATLGSPSLCDWFSSRR
jgi:hypothetical protein